MPRRSHSGPPSRIEKPKPQNAAPAIQPTSVLVNDEQPLEVAHDVAADGERHRGRDRAR